MRHSKISNHFCRQSPRHQGFTLVEGIVAALISAILAGVLLTIMTMNNNGVKDGAVNTKVQTQYEVAMAEIGTAARKATAILNANATPAETFPPALTLTAGTTSKIEMYYQDAAGTVTKFKGFWVDNGVLKECSAGWTNTDYRPFKVGSWDSLKVPDAAPFQLSADRRTLTVSMPVTGTYSGGTAAAAARGDVFTCRN